MKTFLVVKAKVNLQEGYVLDLSPEAVGLAIKGVVGVPIMQHRRKVGTVLAARWENEGFTLELAIDDEAAPSLISAIKRRLSR